MLRIFTFLMILLLPLVSFSQAVGDYRSAGAGPANWNAAASWDRWSGAAWVNNPAQGYPGQNAGTNTVTIQTGHIILLNVSPANNIGALQLQGSGQLQFSSGFTLNVTGDVNMDGTSRIRRNAGNSIINANTLTIAATATNARIGRFTFNVTNTATIDGYVDFDNTGTKTFGSLVINAGGEMRFTAGLTMNITNDMDVVGTFNDVGSGGTINVSGSLVISAGGEIRFTSNFTMNITNDMDVVGTFNDVGGGGTISVSGNLHTFGGSSLGLAPTTSTTSIIVTGTWTVEAGGTTSVGRITITMNTVAPGSATTIDGTLLFAASSAGTKTFRDITISSTGTWNNNVGEDPRINGNLVNNGSWIGCPPGTNGGGEYLFGRNRTGSGDNYSISGNAVSFSRLSIEGGTTLNNNGTIIIDGNVATGIRNRATAGTATFNNGNGATLYLQTAGATTTNPNTEIDPTANGLVFNTSTTSNTVYYSSSEDQNIRVPDDVCYYDLVCSNTGTKTLTAATSIKNSVTIQDAAILNAGTNTFNDGCAGTADLIMTGTSELRISKNNPTTVPEFTGTYSLTGGTITLNGVAQTLRPSITYYNLALSGTGAVTMTNITDIDGNITVSNTASISNNAAFSMNCDKTFTYNSTNPTTLANSINVGNFAHTNNGNITDAGYTITVCGSSFNQTNPCATNNFIPTGRVVFNPESGTCSVTSTDGTSIFRFKNVTINANKILVGDVNGMNIGSGGSADWTNNGTFTHNNGTVTIIGNTSILGSAENTFYNLVINNTFTLTAPAANMNIEKNWTNNNAAGGFTHNSGTVTFTAGNTQTITKAGTETFYNLIINKTTGTTVTSAVTTISIPASGKLTMTEGIFDINTNTISGAGDFYAAGGDLQLAKTSATVPGLTGAYNITGGTVTLDGAGVQTLNSPSFTAGLGSNTYYNLVFATSGAKTITGLLTIDGNVTVSGSATLTANSAFTQATSKTFNYNSSGTTTLAASTNVIVGAYSQTAGILDINSNDFTVRGNWNKTAGTYANNGTSRTVFQGAGNQTFTDNGTTFNTVTIDNGNHVTLSNDMTISGSVAGTLTFNLGNIVTGASNYVILTSTSSTNVSRTSGHVEGNLRKAIPAAGSTRTFEVGTGSDYTFVDFSFSGTTSGGNLTVSSSDDDNTNILSSDINPSKTINRFWTITNNTIVTLSYDVVFNFVAGDVDVSCNTSNVIVERYDGAAWNTTTIGTKNATNTQITTASTPITGNIEYFQIGEQYTPSSILWNAKNGVTSYNWNDQTTWIQDMVGSIQTDGTAIVTCPGGNCYFSSGAIPLQVNDTVMFQSAPGTVLGKVISITDDNTFVLDVNAPAAGPAPYGRQKVPNNADIVNIGNPYISGAAVTIVVNAAAEALRVNFTSMAQGNTLQHNAGMGLSIVTNMNLNQPSNANTNAWNINAGNATVTGNVTIGSGDGGAGKISRIAITTGGALNINSNLIYSTATAANAVLNLTGGTGTVNLSGALTLSSAGTLSTTGTENIFNYTGTATQTVTFGSSIVYRNLYISNSGNGTTLGNNVTNANVTGDLVVQSGGKLFSGGFNIGGNGTRTFLVENGATFRMTAGSTFPNNPTSFGTYTFQPSSTVEYWQTGNQNISVQTYGNLSIQPAANSITHTFQVGTTTVAGILVLGNGTNTGVVVNTTATAAIIDVNSNISLSANTTFNISSSTASPVVKSAGDFINNGGTYNTGGTKTTTFDGSGDQQINGTASSQTFYNVIIDKTGGTLSCGGSTTSLTVNNLTTNVTNASTFTCPASLTINGTLSHSGGTINSGTNIYAKGDWTIAAGATFSGGTGTVTFNSTTAGQAINGTLATKSFNNLVVDKTGQILSTGGGTTTVTAGNFTLTAGTFTAPATVTMSGILLLSAGTYTAGANTNVAGNITLNGGTFTPGANTITLNGSSAQTLGGSATWPTLNNITLENSYPATGITLSKPITVNGALTLKDGHLITDATNILTLTDLATVTLTPTESQDSTFIKGPMAYQEDDNGVAATKVFPVGNGNLMHQVDFNVTHSSAGTNTYTAIYYGASDADFATASAWSLPGDASLDKVSGVGHWDLSKSGTASLSSGSVKLYYLASDKVSVAGDLRIAKGNSPLWANINGTGTGSPTGTITSATNFTTFSRFALANRTGGGNPLPIELLSLDAELNNGSVDLTWITATETNNDYFTIERSQSPSSSNEGWTEVIKVKSNAQGGNSSELLDYSTIDENPYKGISYYRLKQTDFDGKFTYSGIIAVSNMENISEAPLFTVFPNPSDGKNINVSFSGNENNEEVLVVLNDMDGKLVFSKVVLTDDNGSFLIAIDPENRLPAGIYLVVGSSKKEIFSRKLVIK